MHYRDIQKAKQADESARFWLPVASEERLVKVCPNMGVILCCWWHGRKSNPIMAHSLTCKRNRNSAHRMACRMHANALVLKLRPAMSIEHAANCAFVRSDRKKNYVRFGSLSDNNWYKYLQEFSVLLSVFCLCELAKPLSGSGGSL